DKRGPHFLKLVRQPLPGSDDQGVPHERVTVAAALHHQVHGLPRVHALQVEGDGAAHCRVGDHVEPAHIPQHPQHVPDVGLFEIEVDCGCRHGRRQEESQKDKPRPDKPAGLLFTQVLHPAPPSAHLVSLPIESLASSPPTRITAAPRSIRTSVTPEALSPGRSARLSPLMESTAMSVPPRWTNPVSIT